MSKKPRTPTISTHPALRITSEKIELTIATPKTVKKHAEIKLEPQIIQQGEIVDTQAFRDILSQFLKQNPLPGKNIVLGIPEHSSFIKSFDIEGTPENEIKQKILWLSEQQLPLPEDELYLDWAWLPESTEKIQMAAIPKKVVDSYLSSVKQFNLTPLAIESTSLSLRRLLGQPQETTMLIDVDSTTTLIIVEPSGAVNLSAVSHSTSMDQLNPQTSTIVTDMINYYQQTYQQTIKKILYTGTLSQKLPNHLPKNIASQILKLPVQINPSHIMGYALSQIPTNPSSDPKTINLLPPTLQEVYSQAAIAGIKRQLLIISSIFLIMFNLVTGGFLVQIITKQSNLPPTDQQQLTESDLLGKINAVNQQSEAVLQIATQKQDFTQAFSQTLKLLPPEITINHIAMDASSQRITIRGLAPTQDQVIQLKQKLEETDEFTNVTLPLSVLERQTNVEFTLIFKWQKSK